MSAAPAIPPDVFANLQREAALVLAERGEELPWPARGELPPTRTPAPSMPVDLVPLGFRAWIADEVARLGSCVEFIATPAILSAGSVLGRSLAIRPKRRDRWTVTPNLWGVSIGRPSAMKSPSANAGLYPIRRLAAEALKDHLKDQKVAGAKLAVLNAQRAALLRTAKKATDTDALTRDVQKIDCEIEAAKILSARRRHLVNDCTVEALQEILAQNPRGLLQHRDELSGFVASMGRDGHENDRPFFLEAYEGGIAGSYESDRIARGNVRAESPTLAIFGTTQPGRWGRLVDGAVAGKDGADGFLQRVQLGVWPDEPGEGRGVDRAPDNDARDAAFRIFQHLDRQDRAGFFGAEQEDGSPDYLRFDRVAQPMFDDWLEDHFDEARAAGDTPAFEEYLVKQRKTVPALALIFHAVNVAGGFSPAGPVGADALDLAVNWGQFLKIHAQKIYATELRQAETAAHAFAARLVRSAVPDGLTVADIGERDWSGLADTALVHSALDILEPLGWVRRVYQTTAGRTRTVVRVHPDFRQRTQAEEDPG